jgi:hypothetical protein
MCVACEECSGKQGPDKDASGEKTELFNFGRGFFDFGQLLICRIYDFGPIHRTERWFPVREEGGQNGIRIARQGRYRVSKLAVQDLRS